MRLLRWLPLLGCLAVAAARDPQGQEALVDLASLRQAQDTSLPHVNPEQESDAASHKQNSGGILQAVEAVVASLSGQPQTEEPQPTTTSEPLPSPPPSQSGQAQGEEGAGVVKDAGAGEEVTTEATTENTDAEGTTEAAKPLTKGERKAISQYNEVTDQVLQILAVTLQKVEPIPLTLQQRALEALEEEEEEPVPEPEAVSNKPKRKRKKNRKNKNKRKRGEPTEDVEDVEGEEEVVEEAEGQRKRKNKRKNKNDNDDNDNNNKRKRNKKNKNKRRKNQSDASDVEEEAGKKNKRNRNNNNRRKNKRNNNKKNKDRRNKAEDIELHRDGRVMSVEDDEGTLVIMGEEQGRRRNNNRKNKKGGNNKRKRGKKGKKGKKNKKNKRGKKGDKGRSELEEEEIVETGPVYPTPEERAAANAELAGLTRLARTGDVTLDRNANRDLFTARVSIGPLAVQLSEQGRALKKARVTADLAADITFKIRTKGRRIQVIKVKDVSMGDLTSNDVNVARSDLVLEPEVIEEAKNEVVDVVDVSRVGRIIMSELEAIFSEDDIVPNLPHHKFLNQ